MKGNRIEQYKIIITLHTKKIKVMKLKFPKDYTKINHRTISGAVQFKPKKETPVFISIVGGGQGLYGNGSTSFELMIGDKVHGWIGADEINAEVNKVLELITY
jgi:hypothetical protein